MVEAEHAAADLWTRAAERLRARLSRHTFQTYFDPIRPVALAGDQLTLAHSSKFMIDWVRDNLLDVLLQDLEAQRGKPCTVNFIVRERPAGHADGEATPAAASSGTTTSSAATAPSPKNQTPRASSWTTGSARSRASAARLNRAGRSRRNSASRPRGMGTHTSPRHAPSGRSSQPEAAASS